MLEKLLNLKTENSDKIIFIENGIFYYCFEEDAYIISYLLDYKISNKINKDCICFPKNSINKVKKELRKNDIGYVIDNVINYGDSIKYHELMLKGKEYFKKTQYLETIKRKIKYLSIDDLKNIVSML